MQKELVSINDFPFVNSIIKDLLNESDRIKPFIQSFSSLKSIIDYSEKRNFSLESRKLISSEFKEQYSGFKLFSSQEKNISLLNEQNTFTICTGHQLNLFGGPAYFVYKIASVINMCSNLNNKDKNAHYVPVFWMATEDHDFEEINHFYLNNTKLGWETNEGGMVGDFKSDRALHIADLIQEQLGLSISANYLVKLFKDAYSKPTLTDSTRYLVQELFGEFGVLCLDGNSKNLKTQMIPYFEKEIKEQISFKAYQKTNNTYPKQYKRQINARENNLFYLGENFRERIIPITDIKSSINEEEFLNEDILKDLNENPEKYSPNVLLRPLYQEIVLPNLAYVGGGGEISYWTLLKEVFKDFDVDFPILTLRQSVLFLPKKYQEKWNNSDFEWKDLLQDISEIKLNKAKENYKIPKEVEVVKNDFLEKFNDLKDMIPAYNNQVEASNSRFLKDFKRIEKRLFREFKEKQQIDERLFLKMKNSMFPDGKFQERYLNFSSFYFVHKENYINKVVENSDPFKNSLLIFWE